MALGPSPPAKRIKFDYNNSNGHSNQNQSNSNVSGAIPAQLQPHRRLQAERRSLPVFPVKSQILKEIAKTPTLILIGETGCGKTTQIPQFIYEEKAHGGEGVIGITQPRRVAAISLAMRVSQEMNVDLGQEVGYSVRFDSMHSDKTKILYMTDGMLLREAITDPLLKRYSFIILDEAHERTLHTDVLFGIVKEAQEKRKARNLPEMKILIMSATMDVDHFSAYFNKAPVVYVEGRQFPIKLSYMSLESTDYIHDLLVAIFQLHQHKPPEQGILAFLTGQDEIEHAVSKCREVSRELPPTIPKMAIIPLYAAMAPQTQLRVFDAYPTGTRKVVIATNIAETSLTIPGIRIVIDSGKVKSRVYDAARGIDMLKIGSVSKAQACQRTGRAGREAAGACYRLYSEAAYESFSPHTMPEILRCNLAGIILELLAMRITDIQNFDFIDKPKPEAIDAAIKELTFLGAVEEVDQPGTSNSKSQSLALTALGSKMALFALDPKLSRMLLASVELKCVADMLSVVSVLSSDSFFINSTMKKEECEAARRKFFSPEGDLITMLNVYRAYRQSKADGKHKQWCQENFINSRAIGVVEQVREQLRDICIRLDIPIDSTCGQNKQLLRRAICYGLFMNAATLDTSGDGYRLVESGLKTSIHPSSCLFQHKSGVVVYSELVLTNQLYMRDVTVVDPEFLNDAAPEYFKQKHLSKDK